VHTSAKRQRLSLRFLNTLEPAQLITLTLITTLYPSLQNQYTNSPARTSKNISTGRSVMVFRSLLPVKPRVLFLIPYGKWRDISQLISALLRSTLSSANHAIIITAITLSVVHRVQHPPGSMSSARWQS
jgi:hypothetical protein